jgi:GNAT superfamily N-acetyltransferase
MPDIQYRISPPVDNQSLNTLFAAAWPNHQDSDFSNVLAHSLIYVCAYDGERLVGFVNVAWDGGIHAFILDTSVHSDWQRQGIGIELVKRAADEARRRGIEWLHVDYEPHLEGFYRRCGFRSTLAGLINLK